MKTLNEKIRCAIGYAILVPMKGADVEQKSNGGIIMPGTGGRIEAKRGEVAAIGMPYPGPSGWMRGLPAGVGDVVAFRAGVEEIVIDGVEYAYVPHSSILYTETPPARGVPPVSDGHDANGSPVAPLDGSAMDR